MRMIRIIILIDTLAQCSFSDEQCSQAPFPLTKALMKHATLFGVLALVASAPSCAHHIWIEQQGASATLQFGEFADNLRETSPGLLDKFGAPGARVLGPKGERPLTLTKTAQGFVLSGAAGADESIVAQDSAWPMFENTRDGKTTRGVWTPAARYVGSLAPRQPALAFDIVPQGEAGRFTVYYKGQPLAKAKVSAIVPNGWSREQTTDDQGQVRFDLPWQGAYVLEAHHVDKQPGERQGERYDSASFVTSLSFKLAAGLPALAPAFTPASK